MTKVREKRFVACPFSAAVEFAERAANRHRDLYLTPGPPLGERVSFAVAATEDSSDETRKHDALLIAWRPQTRGLFPDFRGVLTVRPQRAGVVLQIDGEYEPPFGLPGKIFDFIIGRAIAHRTMRNLLDYIAQSIQREYEAEKVQRPAVTGSPLAK
jgi:hypothetical protein